MTSEFGLDFIDEIDSMHGFAYYRKDEQQLWLSRDHAGIKPLYYAEIKEGLVFGSETKGLPKDFYQTYKDQMYELPMFSDHIRSLNLSNTATAVAFECLRCLNL